MSRPPNDPAKYPTLKRTTVWTIAKVHDELIKILTANEMTYSAWIREKELEQVSEVYEMALEKPLTKIS